MQKQHNSIHQDVHRNFCWSCSTWIFCHALMSDNSSRRSSFSGGLLPMTFLSKSCFRSRVKGVVDLGRGYSNPRVNWWRSTGHVAGLRHCSPANRDIVSRCVSRLPEAVAALDWCILAHRCGSPCCAAGPPPSETVCTFLYSCSNARCISKSA
jgi:hypothetical protein